VGRARNCIVLRILRQLQQIFRDESGSEVLEYAVVTGLIVMAAISLIGKVGTKVLARWNSLNSSM
jgi:Flp pilus assembly pilin Flp